MGEGGDTLHVFDGPNGEETLVDLFDGRSQLVVYQPHVLSAVSRAPVPKLTAYAKRLGFAFHWVSSGASSFSADFGVYFDPEELAKGGASYNYGSFEPKAPDMPGFSVFIRQGDDVFHTYSTYGRGMETMNPTYALLDLIPKGRDEEPGRGMAWLRRRDEYAA